MFLRYLFLCFAAPLAALTLQNSTYVAGATQDMKVEPYLVTFGTMVPVSLPTADSLESAATFSKSTRRNKGMFNKESDSSIAKKKDTLTASKARFNDLNTPGRTFGAFYANKKVVIPAIASKQDLALFQQKLNQAQTESDNLTKFVQSLNQKNDDTNPDIVFIAAALALKASYADLITSYQQVVTALQAKKDLK